MNNLQRYNSIHSEVMARLEKGELTTEQAKDVIDLAFDKYMIESSEDIKKLKAKLATLEKECKVCEEQLRKLNETDITSDEYKKYNEIDVRRRGLIDEIRKIKRKIDGDSYYPKS